MLPHPTKLQNLSFAYYKENKKMNIYTYTQCMIVNAPSNNNNYLYFIFKNPI